MSNSNPNGGQDPHAAQMGMVFVMSQLLEVTILFLVLISRKIILSTQSPFSSVVPSKQECYIRITIPPIAPGCAASIGPFMLCGLRAYSYRIPAHSRI